MTKYRLSQLLLATLFFACAVMFLPTELNAQGQLRYQTRYNKADVGRIISKLETSSNTFRRDFDRAMDNSSLNGSSTEDRYNAEVRQYENSLDRLRRDFDRNDNWWETRSDVSDVIREAQTVNTMMNTIAFRRNLERQWNSMRNDLNSLADTYDQPGLNGGGWNGGGGGWNPGNPGNPGWGGGGGQTSTPPSWAQGTFYSTNGTNITLTLDRSGRVTVVNAGQTFYGTYNRGQMRLNNDVSTVSKINNGIRTYNRNTGQNTDYSRSGGGGWNPNPGWGGGGNTSRPPDWAQGMFYSTDGTNISLNINSNGQITVVNGGQSFYGTYYNGSMTLNNDVSTISKTRNGIRTLNRNTGQTTDYRRNAR
jgi:hypothetical protein